MNLNSNVRHHLAIYFSTCVFKNYQFKDIRKDFISQYPQYASKKFYYSIYNFVQKLVNFEYIKVNNNSSIFKYSYDGQNNAPLNFLKEFSKESLIDQFSDDQQALIEYKMKLEIELNLYRKKLTQYPILEKQIKKIITENSIQLNKVNTEIEVLNKLRRVI